MGIFKKKHQFYHVAFSRSLLIYKIKNCSNKFGPSFSTASFLPSVTTKVECQFFVFYLVEINMGHLFQQTKCCHLSCSKLIWIFPHAIFFKFLIIFICWFFVNVFMPCFQSRRLTRFKVLDTLLNGFGVRVSLLV